MPVIVPLHGQWDAGQADDASHKRQRQTSWCSTAGASEPIDIPPHSPPDDHLFGEFQTITTALTGGDYTNSHTNSNNHSSMNGYSSAPCRPDASGEVGCWSASWYRSEPWKNSEALESGTLPEKPPAHIMIWEERTARSASQAAAMAARESMGRRALSDADDDDDDDELPHRGDTSSEDSIFEMDM